MGLGYRLVARPMLALLDSEKTHHRIIRKLKINGKFKLTRGLMRLLYSSPELNVARFGIKFRNPVGLAAGMDKNAEALHAWECLGFGLAEVGGVTLHEQSGNPKPLK